MQPLSRHKYSNTIKNFINKCSDKITFISFKEGHCGGLIYRILAHCSDKYYWQDNFSQIDTVQTNKGPLDWPNEGFGYKEQANSYDEKGNFVPNKPLEQRLTALHIGAMIFSGSDSDEHKFWGENKMLQIFAMYIKKAKNKTVLLRTHDLHVHTKFPNIQSVRIFGKTTPHPNTQWGFNNFDVLPVKDSNVVNVDIDKILSKDYRTFETEYLLMCNNLQIKPSPIPVRGYILNFLDRINNYSNSVIPRLK